MSFLVSFTYSQLQIQEWGSPLQKNSIKEDGNTLIQQSVKYSNRTVTAYNNPPQLMSMKTYICNTIPWAQARDMFVNKMHMIFACQIRLITELLMTVTDPFS